MPKLAFDPSLIEHRLHDFTLADLRLAKKQKAVNVARAILGGPRFDKCGVANWCDGPETCGQSVVRDGNNFDSSMISVPVDGKYLPTVVIG